jgi:hypothetical protein
LDAFHRTNRSAFLASIACWLRPHQLTSYAEFDPDGHNLTNVRITAELPSGGGWRGRFKPPELPASEHRECLERAIRTRIATILRRARSLQPGHSGPRKDVVCLSHQLKRQFVPALDAYSIALIDRERMLIVANLEDWCETWEGVRNSV